MQLLALSILNRLVLAAVTLFGVAVVVLSSCASFLATRSL